MIRLCRKIRHKLLSEQSYGIYILYASGEMLLVVVGILFALQIDNWNETHKERQEELGILTHLHDDLVEAHRQSLIYLQSENELRDYLLTALTAVSRTDSLWPGRNYDSIFLSIIWYVETEIPVINSYTEIKNSGKAGLITNEEIRRYFTNLELSFSNLQSVLKDRLYVQQLRIDAIAVDDINYVRLAHIRDSDLIADNEAENDYTRLLNNPKIRNLLAIKLNLTNTIIRYQKELGEDIAYLIPMLEEEIAER